MKDVEKLIRPEYETLTAARREEALRAIAGRDARFRLLRFERFERFGRRTDTALYDCGGLGMALGYLPLATHYRDQDIFDDRFDYRNDIGGDYTFYRRIVRL
jgi:hypothetical protein